MVKGWGKCSAPRLLPRTQSCWAPAGLRCLLTATSFIHSFNKHVQRVSPVLGTVVDAEF